MSTNEVFDGASRRPIANTTARTDQPYGYSKWWASRSSAIWSNGITSVRTSCCSRMAGATSSSRSWGWPPGKPLRVVTNEIARPPTTMIWSPRSCACSTGKYGLYHQVNAGHTRAMRLRATSWNWPLCRCARRADRPGRISARRAPAGIRRSPEHRRRAVGHCAAPWQDAVAAFLTPSAPRIERGHVPNSTPPRLSVVFPTGMARNLCPSAWTPCAARAIPTARSSSPITRPLTARSTCWRATIPKCASSR